MTDAEEIDVTPDWSPDGRSIGVCLRRGRRDLDLDGSCVGGKRLRLNDGGYAPRYSPDSKSILFWDSAGIMDNGCGRPRPSEGRR